MNATDRPYFGGCPECGRNDGIITVNGDHWCICETHKTKWMCGSNLLADVPGGHPCHRVKSLEKLYSFTEVELTDRETVVRLREARNEMNMSFEGLRPTESDVELAREYVSLLERIQELMGTANWGEGDVEMAREFRDELERIADLQATESC